MQPSISNILTHLGEEERDQYFNAIAPPIIQSSNFAYPTIASFQEALANELDTPLYTRGCNPTVAILRQKLAALEHSEDALAFASGAAAIAAAIVGNVKMGDHVICIAKPYGWTFKLLNLLLARFGVTSTFVDGRDIINIKNAIQSNTTLLMLESPNSLSFELQDLVACAELAKVHNIVTVIDNSYCSPIFQNPIDMGIDIVVHSGSKYLNGHSDVVWGALCASKKMVQKIFASEFMTLGAIISPHDAWLVLRGLRTLPIRLQRSQETALKLAHYLENHPKVEYVLYPLLPSFPQFELAQRQMRGAGGLFSVNFKCNDIKQMETFCNALTSTFLLAVSWGGYESLQIPTCIFYGNPDVPPPPLPFSFVRYYVGLEDFEELKAALDKALELL